MMMFAGKLQFLLFSTPKLPFALHVLTSIAEDGGIVLETLTLNPQIENFLPFPCLFCGNFSHSTSKSLVLKYTIQSKYVKDA